MSMMFFSAYLYFWGTLGLFLYRTVEDIKGEREGTTCNKGPQVRVKPAAAASRSKPPYMGACSTRSATR